MRRVWLIILLAFAEATSAAPSHVVVIVWDGMRPDFVTEKNTPTLWNLARDGVTFRNHHSVYPTSTEVNGTAIATGAHPNRSGLLANREYRPQIDSTTPIDTDNAESIRKGDELSNGKYLAVPTVAEIVQAAGKHAVVASTKTVGRLQDRSRAGNTEERENPLMPFPGVITPASALNSIRRALGPFPPEIVLPNVLRDSWTTRALTECLWRDGVPEFSFLWLSEPDLSQHDTAPGSEEGLEGIRSSDKNLSLVLEALAEKKVRGETDLLVVSDHGFSTIGRSVDVPAALNAARFNAVTRFMDPPKTGDIMVVGNGGTVLLYVIGHEAAVLERLVEWLQRSDFVGTIFTQKKIAGSFGLDSAHIDTKAAPDIVFAFRWSETKNPYAVAGEIIADAGRSAGKGSHSTLSRFDVHNTLIAAGPHFRRGETDDLPTGNIDIAPTVLDLLGLHPMAKVDGRILVEAMRDGTVPRAETKTLETHRDFDSGQWRQTLKVSRVGETSYIDESSGAFTPK